jgi:hypothetical protein
MLGNALEEEAGCHRTCKALQEKILGVVLEGNLIVVDYGYSRGVLKSVRSILQLRDPSHSNEYVCKNSPAL